MITDLTKSKMDEEVTITCYRQTEKRTRRDALNYYYEGMCCSEGSEHERYETIFFQLLQGYTEVSDEIDYR